MRRRHVANKWSWSRPAWWLVGNSTPHKTTCPAVMPTSWDTQWPCPWLQAGRARPESSMDGSESRSTCCWCRKTSVTGDLRKPWWGNRYRCPFVIWFRRCTGSVSPWFCCGPGLRRSLKFYPQRWAWVWRYRSSTPRCTLCSLLIGCRLSSFFLIARKLYLKFKFFIGDKIFNLFIRWMNHFRTIH